MTRHFRTPPTTSMATMLANVGRQRPLQNVRVLTTLVGVPFGPRRVVAVGDQYFRVLDMTYQQLRMGVTPAELELTEIEPDDEEDD